MVSKGFGRHTAGSNEPNLSGSDGSNVAVVFDAADLDRRQLMFASDTAEIGPNA
jgi:hypothetical protein